LFVGLWVPSILALGGFYAAGLLRRAGRWALVTVGLLAAGILVTPDDPLGATERVLYLTAAMTGLRQGELLALRWRDVDWTAHRVAC
jgi:integrase